ncbi:hypothetical protein CHS0354_022782 [Potamilus streckersoni]|uniref:G8 domain-containing protein n=1 Tax=Potamilus streckersoni TaxID=2493646 RepID=A0AAE0S2G8_9BIVA|nr:hypothetical protein CHS0354_022782 [Potamilus streckersoni]
MAFCYSLFNILTLFFLLVTNDQTDAVTTCPHEDSSLKFWSDPMTWSSGKPTVGANVTVDTGILLDESSLNLTGINVTSSGKLVFSPNIDINLTINFLEISGEVIIGSESCLHQGNVHVTLAGKRGDFPGIGKAIIVKSGGILEVHGKRKLSWTKLDGTLQKLTKVNGIIYDHRVDGPNDPDSWMDALVAYVFEINAQNQPVKKKFEVFGFYSWNQLERRDTLRKMITELANNEVLLFSLRKNLILSYDLTEIYNVFETLVFGSETGTSKLRTVSNNMNAYAALVYKSSTAVVVRETLTPPSSAGSLATADLTLWDKGLKFVVESLTDTDESWKAKQNFFIFTTFAAYPIITLVDYVTTWNVVPPRYTHWGDVEDGVVDMRAEVALLSRNIIIEGKMENSCYINDANNPGRCSNFNYDTFGGHIKFLFGFKNGRVEGAELYHMGQQTDIGSYPLHFHMCKDTRNYTNKPYLKENSIHHTFARCVTIHGTHGVLVKDNVCYRSLGHSYFLEDGGEKYNTFDGNLALGTLKAKLIPSDSDPTAYWMTNPLNSLINNAGAGGEGKGIWYIYPESPLGLSATENFMAAGEARRTAISLFENNVVHGYESGLFIDDKLASDGQMSCCNDYKPLEDPSNSSSPYKKVSLIALTAYNNWNQNAWIRGGWFEMSNSSLLGSIRGLTYARSSPQEQFIKDSVFIGESTNIGEPAIFTFNGTTVNYHRSIPKDWALTSPRQGFIYYDGPVFAENIWFKGYKKTPYYNMGAIGFLRLNKFSSSTINSMKAAKFAFVDGDSTGNWVINGDQDDIGFGSEDGDKAATFQDVDGSVSGAANNQIVKPYDYYVTDQCRKRLNWKMAICPHDYGKIRPRVPDSIEAITDPIMTRVDTGAEELLTGVESADFMVILGGFKRYILHWSSQIPNPLEIYSDGIEKDKWVTFGVCLPRGVLFDLYSYYPFWAPTLSNWIAASSIADLESATNDGKKYYYDSTNGVLYFKFINQYDRQPGETTACPKDRCPMVKISMSGTNINYTDADCRSRLNIQKSTVTLATDTQSLATVTAIAPEGVGARSTRPFAARGTIDGAWSDFGPWSSCSVTCGGGTQKRYRYCNNPIPHGGAYCVGSSEEQQSCNTQSCSVDGIFSAWSEFSSCVSVNACRGKKTRTRTCNYPINNGGDYCLGATEEVAPCEACANG